MSPSMYVRVKRQRQTIFLHCEPSDTVLLFKEKIAAILGVAAGDQRLLLGKQVLEEGSTLCDCGLSPADTGTELYVVFRIPCDHEERWEEVDLTKGPVPVAPPVVEAAT